MAAIEAAVVGVDLIEQEADFVDLFQQHKLRAYHYALQMLGNADDAMDVTQEAFLRLHRHWRRRDRSRPFAPWMYSVVRNLAIDLLRKRSTRKECEIETGREAVEGDRAASTAPTRGVADARLARSLLRRNRRGCGHKRDDDQLPAARCAGQAAGAASEVPVNRTEQHQAIQRMLSAYLDDELTQADAQRVHVHLEDCEECRTALREMREIQRLTGEIEFRDPPEAALEALEQRLSVRGPRLRGWALVILGSAAWIVYGLFIALRHPRWPTVPELLAGMVVIGLALLFVSVLRQRLLERPHDRYRKVRK